MTKKFNKLKRKKEECSSSHSQTYTQQHANFICLDTLQSNYHIKTFVYLRKKLIRLLETETDIFKVPYLQIVQFYSISIQMYIYRYAKVLKFKALKFNFYMPLWMSILAEMIVY